ncbi:hypothetical protein IEQ34_020293 [Dendrobium chrysotoxum]|uniref:Uncharacterized protein n=1 Tax=Dendrobium chrysotoxum TaxID=161865 RepID=A0AAV7G0J5_DENCH|nr:hypothetical protein IEQ34_020293 [Dendrobium chrysotoxum]
MDLVFAKIGEFQMQGKLTTRNITFCTCHCTAHHLMWPATAHHPSIAATNQLLEPHKQNTKHLCLEFRLPKNNFLDEFGIR